MSEALRSGVCLVGSPPERINCGLAAAGVVGFYLITRCFPCPHSAHHRLSSAVGLCVAVCVCGDNKPSPNPESHCSIVPYLWAHAACVLKPWVGPVFIGF